MADETSQALLLPRPLTASDAAGLEADIVPRALWEAALLLERNFSIAIESAGTLTTAGDNWRILLSPPSPMPNYVFYPIALRATITMPNAVAADTMWEPLALFSVDARGDNFFSWDAVTLSGARQAFSGAGVVRIQNLNPVFHAFPPVPGTANNAALIDNALAAIGIQVDTFDQATLDGTDVHIDCRFLGFPESVVRSAGFYSPRQFFKVA